jgi:hypothetical protein
MKKQLHLLLGIAAISALAFTVKDTWQSKFVTFNADGSLTYHPDEKGNTLPDFSRVGYHEQDQPIPDVPVVKTVEAPKDGDAGPVIQDAINAVSQMPEDAKGFRGTILLKKGTYRISDSIYIHTGGIVLRGEGDDKNGTVLIAAGKGQRTLVNVVGKKGIKPEGDKIQITDAFVPTGAKSFNVASTAGLKVGDRIILFRPSPENWIHDIKMDQIEVRKTGGTKQWKPGEYDLQYERNISKIEGNKIYMDNPVVMEMDAKYGGGAIYKYSFPGRIKEVGVEHILFESDYAGDTDENHGWIAIGYSNIENGWVRNVTSRYFGYACVSTEGGSRNITVTDSKCVDAKSQITGGRRYSFNNVGQLNLFMNLHAEDGRHDYVTGAKVCGPNVFYNCTAKNEHADIGPHHRWASGTLFDNITSDGEINVQDRQWMGSGHGWSGVTQVLWNCSAKAAAVQKPWASGTNYNIGFQGKHAEGSFKGRMDGEWEGLNKKGLEPASLYMAQFKARHLSAK